MTDVRSNAVTDDELLADLFDRLVEDSTDGLEIDIAKLLPERPDLKEQVAEMYRLAIGVAVTGTAARPRFEGYEILRELGRGGMGTVYLARQDSLGREVALKVLPPSVALSQRARRRFLVEARALASLHHDHVVKIHQILERDDVLAYEMEWIEGKTLKEVLDGLKPKGRQATIEDLERLLGCAPGELGAGSLNEYFLRLGVLIARALAKVHSAGLVHRDVKPSNILIRQDGTPVLADFGLVRGPASSMTLTGAFIGTPVYAPPEQLRAGNAAVGPRIDVYALGVTLYEAVARTPPFEGQTAVEILRKIEEGHAPRLRKLAPEMHRDLEIILQKAMESEPEYRYPSADALGDDLERLLRLELIHARPASLARRSVRFLRRHRRPLFGAAIGAALVAAVLIPVSMNQRGQQDIPQRVAQLTRAAHLRLLAPDTARLAWEQMALGRWSTLRGNADTLHQALLSYDAALQLTPKDVGLRTERDVVAIAAARFTNPIAGRGGDLPLAVTVGELPECTARAARALLRTRRLASPADDELQRVSLADRKALGLLAYLVGNFGLCERVWDGLDPAGSNSPLVHAVLGTLYEVDGRSSRAYPMLLRASRDFPEATHLALPLADAALANGEFALAERWLDQAQAVLQDTASRRWLRRIRADMVAPGDPEAARREYIALLAEDPEWSAVHFRVVRLDAANGDLRAASRRLETLVRRWPEVSRYRLARATLALQQDDLVTYLAQARHVLRTDFGAGRSRGSVRDLLEILRIGGLTTIYRRGLAATGHRALPQISAIPQKLPAGWGPFSSREEVEALLLRFAAFDKDGAEVFRLPDRGSPEYGSAVVLSLLCRSIMHFPEVLAMSHLRSRTALWGTSFYIRANWSSMTQRVLPACVAALGLLGNAHAQNHLYTFNGALANREFGYSVAGAGDVNKDGYADLIVGSHNDYKNGPASGSALVFSGKDGKILYTFNGAAGDRFGWSAGSPGDVNKDGFPDFIVGARLGGKNFEGYARVFSGKDGKVLYTLNGAKAGDWFGWSVGGAGDVNKDGHADLIVGALNGGKNFGGYARVFSGKDGKILYTFNGDLAGDAFGISVAGAVDLNRDGFPDLIVGALNDDNNGTDSGSARVFSGKDGRVLYTFNGDSAVDRFGVSVAVAGDVNKDGIPDLIVGALRDDNNGTDSGSARVLSGLWIATGGRCCKKILHTFNGDSAGDFFGCSVAGAGDVNKDGFPDLIVGARLDDNNGTDSGMARVFSGEWIDATCKKRTSKTKQVLYTFNGNSVPSPFGGRFGNSVAGAGDVNKDGFADVIVGHHWDWGNNIMWSGSVRVLSGKKLALTTDIHAFSLAKANTQTLNLDAGAENKGRLYWVFGSVTGTSPGVTLGSTIGLVTIPLNPDPWTDITIALANSPALLVKTKGTLDANGQAKAQIKGGPANVPSAIGLVFHHAYLVYDANNKLYWASNPVPLTLVK